MEKVERVRSLTTIFRDLWSTTVISVAKGVYFLELQQFPLSSSNTLSRYEYTAHMGDAEQK
jgi:hypothetical protein